MLGASRDPAAVAAALLPVAEAIDPKLVPELFWRAVSFHSPRPGAASPVDRLARPAARPLRPGGCRQPVRAAPRTGLNFDESDLVPVLAAAAILDPARAVRVIEALPDAHDLTFHHPENEARLALAAALVRNTTPCWDDAIGRFLDLWIEGPHRGY